ncbi:unnamed protein product, partial [Rotaria magnacalcarata]
KSSAPTPLTPPSHPPPKENTKTDEKKKKKKHNSDDDDYFAANVEIDYVPEDIPVKRGDDYYTHFAKVFENFKLDPTGEDN